jgi:hypothetical protein
MRPVRIARAAATDLHGRWSTSLRLATVVSLPSCLWAWYSAKNEIAPCPGEPRAEGGPGAALRGDARTRHTSSSAQRENCYEGAGRREEPGVPPASVPAAYLVYSEEEEPARTLTDASAQ